MQPFHQQPLQLLRRHLSYCCSREGVAVPVPGPVPGLGLQQNFS